MTSGGGTTGHSQTIKKNTKNLNTHLIPDTKTNLEYIKDQNIKYETVTFLKDNRGETV